MIAVFFVLPCALFALAYFFYGRFLERHLGVSHERTTPAHTLKDDVDYVPTKTSILFGHHFSSIAGAGPIVGPVIATVAFGWAPAIFWIVVGAIFVGGVHDFSALVASLRHHGRSVGRMCRDLLNPTAYYLFLTFLWFTMMYIEIVFLDLTASTFAPVTVAAAEASPAVADQMAQGGAVATASLIYIGLAVVFGLAIYRFKMPVWVGTLIFVPLVFVALLVGRMIPLSADKLFPFLGTVKNMWLAVLLVYCFVAAILPVWILLQPRDYLSSFLLYACLAGGAVGLVLSAVTGGIEIRYPAFITFNDPQLKFIFPALFVTVACGAVSGFHALVASGTTAKQLHGERSARTVAYGGMLVEAVLALIAVAAVAILAQKPAPGRTPVAVFASGLGHFLSSLGLSHRLAMNFGLLAVSTFLLTTLDTCTRLSRFIFEELFQMRGHAARVVGTAASLVIPAFVVFRHVPGPGGKLLPAWQAIWPAFGATNQLMAALALLVVFVWLRREKKKALFIAIPLVFMCVTTLSALAQLVYFNLFRGGSLLVGGLSFVLGLLAVGMMGNAWFVLRRLSAPAGAKVGG